ncbi:MAG TPA: IS1595 family transposase [Fimbriimonadaceae bacterium]|nr:IS1595 family transposase [Fimbriimonadaceae bacterium]
MKGNGPKTLLEAVQYFADEEVCIRTLSAMRWPDGVIPCPNCGKSDHYWLATQKRWKCKACAKQFSVKVGTIMEDSPIKLSKWLCAMWLITNAKNGISSYEVHRSLGITQKTAWFMLHRIRLAMKQGSFDKMGGKGGPEVETDETYVGGKAINMHTRKKIEKGVNSNPGNNKSIVMGILERKGEVRTFLVPDTKAKTLVPIIKENVKPDSWLYSDANPSYVMLADRYRHQTVDHAYEYVDGTVHTNCMENFWSLLKRTIKGTYTHTAHGHLSAYVTEQSFRYNFRHVKDADRFTKVLTQVSGKRLTYKQLTGKELVLEA